MDHQFTVDVVQEFHRRMAAIIVAVQAGIWQRGLHDLLGYATDYAFGQERGRQTLVLKTHSRSGSGRRSAISSRKATKSSRAAPSGRSL